MLKSIIFLVKLILGNFYKHLLLILCTASDWIRTTDLWRSEITDLPTSPQPPSSFDILNMRFLARKPYLRFQFQCNVRLKSKAFYHIETKGSFRPA